MHEPIEDLVGSLVKIIPGPRVAYRSGTGLVMDYTSANVYEPAEVQLLMNGEFFWIRANSVRKVGGETA